MLRPMMIGVIGGNEAPDVDLALAEEVGRELALRGNTVVCGGLGGVMEAACRGARSAGGHTIGILPTMDRRDANPHVEFPVVTGLGVARNAVVVLSSEAVIAVDGSYGTLSEIAMAMQFGIPVVALRSWTFTLPGRDEPPVVRVETAIEAVERALALGAAKEKSSDA
jgi:uncharacterized protein (TIGR00725 family)